MKTAEEIRIEEWATVLAGELIASTDPGQVIDYNEYIQQMHTRGIETEYANVAMRNLNLEVAADTTIVPK